MFKEVLNCPNMPDITCTFRCTDDGFIMGTGTQQQVDNLIARLQTMDTTRSITYEIQWDSIDILDLTIYKGHRFESTGVMDIKQYRKPTSLGMHLARNSHHPQNTFAGILQGAAGRALVASSSKTEFIKALNIIAKEFELRGYSRTEIAEHLDNYKTHSQRQEWILQVSGMKQVRNKPENQPLRILKMPYTSRGAQMGYSSIMHKIHDMACQKEGGKYTYPNIAKPALENRYMCANKATENLRGNIRSH